MARYLVTTAIPYVNGQPHVGHALELVQTDVLARWRRQRGDAVRAQTGTDDNAIKNVLSAEAEGVPTQDYVDRVAKRFLGLGDALDLSFDDFIKTSSDPRHAPGVEKLWNACMDRGDIYQRDYEGLYCTGCELFYTPEELVEGRCPEHGTIPDLVSERNYFFRLSRYGDELERLIAGGALRIEPEHRRNEVLAFIRAGLEDFSASRSVERARGWGIRVPNDPGQVIYVWYDALANYITAPGYGSDEESFATWWTGAESRVHVIGKGILRFHAVYWPAMLLSAGLALPTTVYVHEYLTSRGEKISKSAGNADDPADVAAQYGTDPLRWWFLRDVARVDDSNYAPERLVARANEDLGNTIGNLVNRVVSMVNRYRGGSIPAVDGTDPGAAALTTACGRAATEIDAALDAFDFRRALAAIMVIANEGNRYVEATRPWELAKHEHDDDDSRATLDLVLAELIAACRALATHLEPFIPISAARIHAQLGDGGDTVPQPEPIFSRLEV